MEFQAMQRLAREVADLYTERDLERFGRPWSAEELVLGLVGDVGDLAKLAQGRAGVRPNPDLEAALEHELSDCLWSVMVIADAYQIDLESAFERAMESLRQRLAGQPNERDQG